MWPALAIALACLLIALFFFWRNRCENLKFTISTLEAELSSSRQAQGEMSVSAHRRQLALINNMAEGVLLLGANRRVELINPPLKKLLGIRDEIVGKNVSGVLRMPQFSQLLDQVEQEGAVLDYELEYPGPKTRFLQVNAVAMPSEKERSRMLLLVFHDLTHIRKLENTRKEFVANVSHELRTPLSMIKGCVETLLSGAKENPETRDKFLKTVEKHTARLTFLIEDLLTLSQLESGRAELNIKSVPLNSIIRHTCEDLAKRADEKSIRFVNRIAKDLRVQVDAKRIGQVFFNLLDNAIKYGRAGAEVTIDSRLLDSGRVEVAVRNQGQGIPKEAQERIFERFYRVDAARSREQGGTGLGLAIVKHIVQSHGGQVRVESQPNQGATFFFTLSKA